MEHYEAGDANDHLNMDCLDDRRSSLRFSMSSRHSSVSINLPMETELLGANYLMPPAERPTSSRLSSGSAWDSFRLSVVSFSKVFLVAPCSRHKCCLGCISLGDAIPLICVAEIFTMVFLTMVVLDFWMTDGKTFYTYYFEGYGNQIAICYAVFLLISLPILFFTLYVWYKRKKYLYVFHVLWQWTVIEILLFYTYIVFKWVRQSGGNHKTGILIPSAFVIGGVTFMGAVIEAWWLFVFVDAMFFETRTTDHKYSSSVASKRQSTSHRTRNGLDYESEGSDSRRNSATIPIVKIDRTHSIDYNDANDVYSATSSRQSAAENV